MHKQGRKGKWLHCSAIFSYAPAGQVIVILRVLLSSAKEQACPLIIAVPVHPGRVFPLTAQSKLIPAGDSVPETEIVPSMAAPSASIFTVTGSG